MPMTLEEKIALINQKRKNDKPLAERKQARRDRETDKILKKQTHDWKSVWSVHGSQNGGRGGSRVPLYCKTCGINYQAFKVQPESCNDFLSKDIIE